MRRFVEAVLLGVCALVLIAPSAGAAFPGTNGKIAYDQLTPLPREIHTINPDGTGIATLTTRGDNQGPDWSADGSKIAFVHSSPRGGGWKIMSMAADGSAKTTILSFSSSSLQPYTPTWSLDASQLAFCAFRQNNGTTRVYTVNADGTGLTNVSGSHPDCDPEWSPDGTQLVVDTYRRGSSYVVTMNTDGTGRTRITQGFQPDWSPDGTRVVFVKSGTRSNIATIAGDGTGLALVTQTKRRWEFAPVYSPDGTEIAFSRTQTSELLSPDDLWTIHTDASNPLRVTHTARRDEFDADWQPT